MKISNFRRSRSRGVALVMVLLLIALLSALVLSFFAAVRVETVSSASYSDRTKAQMFADSVKNLAIGQIQKGTEGVDGGYVLAWASQPGMIRTWDQQGDPKKAYKLYSSDQMIVNGDFKSQSDIAKDVPDDWESRFEEFVDLNSPVLAEDTNGAISKDGSKYTARFPIISGNNLKSVQVAGATSAKTYEANIEGFWVEGQPDVSEDQIRPDKNPVPMPVRWLYMLKDGKIASPSSSGSIPGATKLNPAVARVAFWTDDETTKVNINTASEGVFWDRPYNGSWSERMFGNNIPAQNEFASFPGHPATTSLSTVLGSILPVPDWILSVVDYNKLIPYYNLVPRVSDGGSRGGVIRAAGTANIVKYDADRLYSSVDEFIFKAQGAADQRDPNNTSLSNNFLEQARFFLTAHSRAPEVNMFNLPRVSLWPLDPNVQNSKDKLISYCSTINGKPFYFSRTVVKGSNPKAGDFLSTSQSPTMDWDKYGRNKTLYNYLQSLTSKNIPGLGGKLSEKYRGNYRNQILTEMVDLIRSGVNTVSSELDPVYQFAPPRGVVGQGQVVPLTLSSSGTSGSDTKGFGRFMTISEASLVLYHTAQRNPADNYKPVANTVKAVFLMEPFCPSPGLPSWSPNVRIRVKGLDSFRLDGMPLNLPKDVTMTCDAMEGNFKDGFPNTYPSGSTAFPATRLMFYYNGPSGLLRKTFDHRDNQEAPANIYPFVSSADVALPFSVDKFDATPMILDGSSGGGTAQLQIEIYGPIQGSLPLQVLRLDFPKTTILAPEPLPKESQAQIGAPLWKFDNRIPAVTSATNIKDTLFPYAASSAVSSINHKATTEDALPLIKVAATRPNDANQKYKDYNLSLIHI